MGPGSLSIAAAVFVIFALFFWNGYRFGADLAHRDRAEDPAAVATAP